MGRLISSATAIVYGIKKTYKKTRPFTQKVVIGPTTLYEKKCHRNVTKKTDSNKVIGRISNNISGMKH